MPGGRNDANHGTGPRVSGTIARISDKGFGFARAADGREYFIHFSNCAPGVWEHIVGAIAGAGKQSGKVAVTFETAQTAKGLRGLAVELAAG